MCEKSISPAVLGRLPSYLAYLKTLPSGTMYISATMIARALGFGEVSVRKDLAAICDIGRPKTGYPVSELTVIIESFLGYDRMDTAVVAGAGKLGRALLDYKGFREYGIEIAAAFDLDPALAGASEGPKPILHIDRMADYCREHHIDIGIITVPAHAAQQVLDQMAACGIRAVMNFAPIHLHHPKNVTVKNENIAISLALLSKNAGTVGTGALTNDITEKEI